MRPWGLSLRIGKKLKGTCFIKHNSRFSCLCHVESLSEELKNVIRDRLISICHGESKAEKSSKIYSYKVTLKEFIKRYKNKPPKIRKGMIGELLSHILIIKEFPNLKAASPYFNLEEGSIKKGFDLLFFDSDCEGIWIAEVKSGEAARIKSNKKNIRLLNTAKNDLKRRLDEQNTTIWLNAINGANLALKKGKVKDKINEILENVANEVVNGKSGSLNKDVILISVLFKSLNDKILIDSINKKRRKIVGEAIFGKLLVFSIQKETYQKVARFLKDEADK
jgi:hypothetical protein